MAGREYRSFAVRDDLLKGGPLLSFQENFPRDQIAADLVASLSTGVMTVVALPLAQNDQISTLTFLSGATAMVTPTNLWAALYDPSGNLLQQSTTGTPAWGADTALAFALNAVVVAGATAVYFAALMVAATTVPTLMGKTVGRASASGAVVTGQVPLARTAGSALTTTAPATIATPTTIATIPYCVAQDTRS
jgi:hypothetical protein